MNTEEAKLILAAVHDDADRASDPEIGQAFSLLEDNPELNDWLLRERAFDAAVSRKLASVEAPADLKATVMDLLGGQVSRSNTPPHSRIRWFQPPVLAAAAAIILIPLLAIQLFTGRANAKSFDTFRSDMVEFANSEIANSNFKLDLEEQDLPKLYAWLNANNATYPVAIPDCIGCHESVGCKIIDWSEDRVTLICLRNGTKQVVHCFVIPRSEIEKIPDEERIRATLAVGDLETCGWTDQNNLYLLVGSAKGVEVSAPSDLDG